jgi:proteasome lid subunit RPN8/RPN11
MIRIEQPAWGVMLEHATRAYPRECCGILLGVETAEGEREVTVAIPCRNAYDGDQSDRFLIDPEDQFTADRRARADGLDVLGFFHSHPDHGMYFSQTDLKNSWPWYSNIVISIRKGEFDTAGAFRADEGQTAATPEELVHPRKSKKAEE